MKLKSKLVVAASALLVLSGAAAGTGTYAWYTANRSASLAVNTIGAQNQSVSMSVAFDTTDGNGNTLTKKATADDGDTFTLTDGAAMTDVTSDGSGVFNKPMFDATTGREESNVVGWWANEAAYITGNVGSKWFQKFTLKFTMTGGTTGAKTAVYLSPDSTITAAGSEDLDVIHSIRYSAVIGSNVVLYANPAGGTSTANSGTDECYYWKKPDSGNTPVSTAVTASNKVGTNEFFGVDSNLTEASVTSGNGGTYDDPGTGYLFDAVTGGSDVLVSFYVWNEGSDVNCTNVNKTSATAGFKLSLKFYSLQEALMNPQA